MIHVVYHGNCTDGFLAYTAARNALGCDSNVKYHAGHYQQPVPFDPEGATVYLLDFSYPAPVLADLVCAAEKVIVIDHHKTFADALKTPLLRVDGKYEVATDSDPSASCLLDFPIGKFSVIYDANMSGGQLAMQYFMPECANHLFVRYVADYDLWKFDLPFSREINAVIHDIEFSFAEYDSALFDLEEPHVFTDTIKQGETILAHKKAAYTKMAASAFKAQLQGVEVLAICAHGLDASGLGNHLLETTEANIVVIYGHTGSRFTYSLRSRKGVPCDHLAQAYGGGGHANACGFKHADFVLSR